MTDVSWMVPALAPLVTFLLLWHTYLPRPMA